MNFRTPLSLGKPAFHTLRQRGRLILASFTDPLGRLSVWASRHVPEYVSVRIGNAELIGPQELVTQCANIFEELKQNSIELYHTLTGSERLIIRLRPEGGVTVIGARYSCIGKEYLKWQDAGIRAFLVYTAYYVHEKLIYPRVVVEDYCNGDCALRKKVSVETSRWLADHQQPDLLIQYFVTFDPKRK